MVILRCGRGTFGRFGGKCGVSVMSRCQRRLRGEVADLQCLGTLMSRSLMMAMRTVATVSNF